jgi:uncharacterized membrane protein
MSDPSIAPLELFAWVMGLVVTACLLVLVVGWEPRSRGQQRWTKEWLQYLSIRFARTLSDGGIAVSIIAVAIGAVALKHVAPLTALVWSFVGWLVLASEMRRRWIWIKLGFDPDL